MSVHTDLEKPAERRRIARAELRRIIARAAGSYLTLDERRALDELAQTTEAIAVGAEAVEGVGCPREQAERMFPEVKITFGMTFDRLMRARLKLEDDVRAIVEVRG